MDNQQQQRVIEQMCGLRKEGHSYQKVADILNAMKVPTQQSKGRWHANTVYTILQREAH